MATTRIARSSAAIALLATLAAMRTGIARASASTAAASDSAPHAVLVEYAMKQLARRWVGVDIFLDHRRLAQSAISQMQAVLKSGSYSGLVAQMESRLKQQG